MLKLLSSCALICATTPSLAGGLSVVTDLAPVHGLVAMVTEGVSEPVLLMDEPGDGHHFALRPSQAAALSRADLVIWTGPEMAPWMARALEAAEVETLPLLLAPGTRLREWTAAPGGDHAHDQAGEKPSEAHDHDHDHDHGHDHAHDHAHGSTDPHAWLEPANALYWLDLIARRLSAEDPPNAARYGANAKAALAQIRALDGELRATLAPLSQRPMVLGHDAYGYFTAHYGLTVAGTLAAGDAAGPGAQHLSALRAKLSSEGVICAFPEIGQSERLLATLLEGSTIKTGAALDPAGSALPKGPGHYPALMRDLAGKISDCLKD